MRAELGWGGVGQRGCWWESSGTPLAQVVVGGERLPGSGFGASRVEGIKGSQEAGDTPTLLRRRSAARYR